MKIAKNLFLSLTFILIFNLSFSQQKTVYEKKVNAINLNFINELGLKNLAEKYKSTGDFGSIMAMSEMTYRLNTERGLIALLKYKEELKKAESLKTEIDLKKDKEKLEKINAENEKVAIANEKKRIQEEYKKSDYFEIREKIKSTFSNWLLKNEFEKQETFQKRVKEENQIAFDSICNLIIQKKTHDKSFYLREPELEIGKYDSEKEYFNVKIKILNIEIEDTLNIKISEAENFKRNASNRNINRNVISCPKEGINWFIYENNLFPDELIVEINNNKYYKSIKSKLVNTKNLDFSTKELNIENENFTNIDFNYIKSQENEKIKKEKEKKEYEFAQANLIYNIAGVEVKPTYVGGIDMFRKYIVEQLVNSSVKLQDEGKIFINFIVEKDGSISNTTIIKGLNSEINEAIIKIVNSSPLWKSAEQNGKKVRVKYSFPISIIKN